MDLVISGYRNYMKEWYESLYYLVYMVKLERVQKNTKKYHFTIQWYFPHAVNEKQEQDKTKNHHPLQMETLNTALWVYFTCITFSNGLGNF